MKSRVFLALAAAVSLGAATAAWANTPPAATTEGATAAAETATPAKDRPRDPNEVVCKRQEQLGTRLGGKKVCKTRADWASERQSGHDTVDDAQRHINTGKSF